MKYGPFCETPWRRGTGFDFKMCLKYRGLTQGYVIIMLDALGLVDLRLLMSLEFVNTRKKDELGISV